MMSNLQVFNTLTGKKEPFVPVNGKTVHIYACGPTVYDLSHLGHARMAITWDVIQRYLRFSGYEVVFVRNITDIDDKIINRAVEMNMRPEQVAREYTYEFWKDMHALNVAQPDFEPRCTEFVPLMISFIDELIKAGHAYAAGGDVYFDVQSFKKYGKLSKQNVEQLLVGSRDQVRSQEDLSQLKKSPVDFAMWKGAADNEMGWASPWGRGRPGWHIECSAMIKTVLGETIDIHGGGEDLVFPHHENEIAQSESLHGKPLAKYWLHNSFVQVSSEKMSKSLGNFNTIQDLLVNFSPDSIRLLILQTHYRNPIDFTHDSLVAARTAVNRLVRAASYTDDDGNGNEELAHWSDAEAHDWSEEVVGAARGEFIAAMDNDFNTAQALTPLFALADKIYTITDEVSRKRYARALKYLAGIVGLTLVDNRLELNSQTAKGVMALVLNLRQSARSKKDYETSDLIRKHLAELGINVMDGAGGSSWERG